ncbi:MAG: pyridoxamine 5'-phosphate oxidase family protein [Thermoplasmatota archaeon]
MLKGYHMQRSDREIGDQDEMMEVLKRGKYITLALSRNNDPYIVTLSYGLDERGASLYFHSSAKGAKLEIIRENPKACGTVIEDLGYQHNECSHKYRSVVLTGRIVEITGLDEKKEGMLTMFRHLESEPDAMKERFLSKDADHSRVNVLKMDIEEMTGKESC